ECSPHVHSGVGYGFRAWQGGMRWHALGVSAGREGASAAIYDDLVFHLGGATRLADTPGREIAWPLRRLGPARFGALVSAARAVVPTPVRRRLRAWLRGPLAALIDRPRVRWWTEAMVTTSRQLLADPEAYIQALRRKGPG